LLNGPETGNLRLVDVPLGIFTARVMQTDAAFPIRNMRHPLGI